MWRDPTPILNEAYRALKIKLTNGKLADGKDYFFTGGSNPEIAERPTKIDGLPVNIRWEKRYMGKEPYWNTGNFYRHTATIWYNGVSITKEFDEYHF